MLLLLFLLSVATAEQCVYSRYSGDHSFCKTQNTSCQIVPYHLTAEDIDYILKFHNNYRDVIASGRETLPGATNMLQMEWDEELANIAQSYAEQCIYEHEQANKRRVKNFGVGQNIAYQRTTGNLYTIPQPEWSFAMSEWFSEIIYFPENNICPFNPPDLARRDRAGEFRHFSQLMWAETFRVGCGYVLYRTGQFLNEIVRLYFCNYGPNGNVYGTCMYEAGAPCSNCPQNTCCGSSCGRFQYENLCKRERRDLGDPAPYAELKKPYFFHCDFHDQEDCRNYVEGVNKWTIEKTLSCNFVSVILNGGENSTLILSNPIKPTSNPFCVTLRYRKGPHNDWDQESNTAMEIFEVKTPNQYFTNIQTLQGYGSPDRHLFATYNMTLSWMEETTVKFSFSVPIGAPPQFLEVKEIIATEGGCLPPLS